MTYEESSLLAFHNDPTIKEKYLARMRGHVEAGELIRGVDWENGRGCVVGCTFHAYEPARGPIEIGVPEWLMRLEDTLCERMPAEDAPGFALSFLEAIPVGVDCEQVKRPFLVFVLTEVLATFDHDKFPGMKSAVERAIVLWQREDIGSDAWHAEAVKARAEAVTAWKAEAAEGVVAWEAVAGEVAAWAAEAAEAAGEVVARGVVRTAVTAARTVRTVRAARTAWVEAEAQAHKRYANKLLELLRALPAGEGA